MSNPTPQDINRITDFESLLVFLHDKLDWPVEPSKTIEDVTFDYAADELRIPEASAERLHGGIVRQLRDSRTDQKIGIFFVEFSETRVYATSLRQILRGLVTNRRQSGQRRTWDHENLLFICSTKNYEQFTFAHFSGEKHTTAKLSSFGWQRGDTHLRTLCEFNLPALAWPDDPDEGESWLKKWSAAFDVERVTDEFFRRYDEVFTSVEKEVQAHIPDERNARLYTQRLFNRLMFIYFIEKKGWLSFNGDSKYLRALFNDAVAKNEGFLRDRLHWLFFYGMGTAGLIKDPKQQAFLEQKRGVVPYLNGGLFDIEDNYDAKLSKDQLFQAADVKVSNEGFAKILGLFERYNFTVEESTPLDVQVAVDPEMLGKVFEELVTGRHETGSYYTPRPIVSFMCREALKHYLADVQASNEAISKFVDEEDASELQNPEAVLDALKRVRVCDPACGSGAYLLGMMHELTRLRAALFKSNKIDDATLYERKRWIIENNLYGVDNDKFATQIACLRLWLSLAIESDEPHPLPNLDFKIECGDSLTGPAPSEAEKQMTFARTALVNDFRQVKGEHMRENDPERKLKLRQRILDLRAELALALKHKSPKPTAGQLQKKHKEIELLEENIPRVRDEKKKSELEKSLAKNERTLAEWQKVITVDDDSFDWAVEFAEVFMPTARKTWRMDGLHPLLNDFKTQGTLVEATQPKTDSGGFDIIVANPPYVRMELFKPIKPTLRRNFPDVHSDRADLYVYFYDRAHQLLKDGGIGVFISSNKWLTAGYGEKLRQHLLDKQEFHLVVDFGDLPVFKASAYPAIFLWARRPRNEHATLSAVVRDLQACYSEGVREHINQVGYFIPASQFARDKARLTSSKDAGIRAARELAPLRLRDLIAGRILYGIKTGLNEAFVISDEAKRRLIEKDPGSSDVIKSLLAGDDVRRNELHFRETHLLYMPHGIEIKKYPAIQSYLRAHRQKLEKRATKQEWFELQQPQAAYVPFFDSPKIIYPQIMLSPRFCMDEYGHYINQKCFAIPYHDWFVLGLLNSEFVWQIIKESSPPLRGGYAEPRYEFMLNLPVPDAPTAERNAVAKLAEQTQELHMRRRKVVEKFLRTIGIERADSSSRNPLERPWMLTADEFSRRARNQSLKAFTHARDETSALTEQITKIEREIDERVAALYGVPLETSEKTI